MGYETSVSLKASKNNTISRKNSVSINHKKKEDDDSSDQGQKLKRVTFNAVEEIGKELNCRMQIKRLTINKVQQYLLSDSSNGMTADSIINLKSLENNFKKEPFNLKKLDSIRLLSRFLVEDNSSDYTIFDKNVSNSAIVVKSIFKNVLGTYHLLTVDEIKILHKSINVKLMEITKNSLKKTFDYIMQQSRSSTIDEKMIDEAFKASEHELSQDEMKYII